MSKRTSGLTVLKVQSLSEPGRYGDGNGLYLQVSRGGSKSWIFRYAFQGRAREMGLGGAGIRSLSEARESALDCRKLLFRGIDPIRDRELKMEQEIRNSQRAITFNECARNYIDSHRQGWKSAKHAAQWISTLERYASPFIGSTPISDICTDDILKVLEPIWVLKPETANRVRNRIELVLSWASARGYRPLDNPARWRGHLNKLLSKRAVPVIHHAAMPLDQVQKFMTELRLEEGIATRALEFLILTATRTAETLGATWPEIDFSSSCWTIPAERMKAKKAHRIPLSIRAIEILLEQKAMASDSYIFAGRRKGRPLSNMALLAILRRKGTGVTTHGFRSTFRDWASECTSYAREIAEAALAHSIRDKVEAAYRRGDLFNKRRDLMRDWAQFCSSEDAVMPSATLLDILSYEKNKPDAHVVVSSARS